MNVTELCHCMDLKKRDALCALREKVIKMNAVVDNEAISRGFITIAGHLDRMTRDPEHENDREELDRLLERSYELLWKIDGREALYDPFNDFDMRRRFHNFWLPLPKKYVKEVESEYNDFMSELCDICDSFIFFFQRGHKKKSLFEQRILGPR